MTKWLSLMPLDIRHMSVTCQLTVASLPVTYLAGTVDLKGGVTGLASVCPPVQVSSSTRQSSSEVMPSRPCRQGRTRAFPRLADERGNN